MNDVDGLGHWRADLARHRHGIRGADAAQGCDGEGETMSDELAQGGNGGPEIIFLPKGAQVYPQKQDQPGQQFNIMIMPFKNTQELRAFVQAIVRETLEEDARAIRERKEFQATKQAGICYACLFSGDDMERFEQGGQSAWIHKSEECRQNAIAISEHKAREANVPDGVCWACKRSGKANEMEWRDMHLIHATEYCRDLAASLPPVREHRG